MVQYKVQPGTEKTAHQMEFIRLSSYGIVPHEEDYDPHYIKEICNGNILVFTCYYEGKLVAGCYISNTFHTIYVDYLFVLPEYQEQGLHLGRNLLEFVLSNKTIVEDYFQESFSESKLCTTSDKSTSIYKKIGYQETEKEDLLSKKIV